MDREGAMSKTSILALVMCCTTYLQAPVARACGGFFCGRQPVDQTAERILFKVNPNSVTMIVQIAYAGPAPDFAWVLPLGNVPDPKTLGTFPQRALTALDANTAPQFDLPSACQRVVPLMGGSANAGGRSAAGVPEADSGVSVHFREEVGPYEVAAIESDDPMALYEWLKTEGFNVNEMMLPYIRTYTAEGMKFLALKLQKDKDTTDITPFRFDLAGSTPSIPLRMTALAAEPEMSILVFVLGDQRFDGANWPAIEIRDDQIASDSDRWPASTNWAALVARGVDEAGGLGWVTELAGSTTDIVSLLDNASFATPDDMKAGQELRALIGESTYISRLYTRMSAEEMGVDPSFRKTNGGDVSNVHQLSRFVDGVDQCGDQTTPRDPCRFTSCGAGGICRPVMPPGATEPVAACGCVSGAAARTTFDPASVSLQATAGTAPAATVVCQDQRMSFVNPGDVMTGGEVMPDPCQGFDCGPEGECNAINMTPTCVCDQGYVAYGSFNADGTRRTTCAKPMLAVPSEFYLQRLPNLPASLPGGRSVMVDMAMPVVAPSMGDLGSTSGALPKPNATPEPARGDASSGCSTSKADASSVYGAILCAIALAIWFTTKRRSRP
jgi:hypothetical protein